MMVGLGFLALFPDSLILPEKVCGVPILVKRRPLILMNLNRMKQYIEHGVIKRSFVIKQVELRSFQEIDKAEETDSNIDCPSLIKDELKDFRIRKSQKTKTLHHISQDTPDAA